MGRVIKIALTALLVLLPEYATAEPETLTLSCDGTVTSMMTSDSENKPEVFTKMGLLVNLADGTVLGFGTPARIKKTDAVSVEFGGEVGNSSVSGTIDRITGSVLTSTYLSNATKLIFSGRWDMHCKPTKRVF